jgi:hypothetical protein
MKEGLSHFQEINKKDKSNKLRVVFIIILIIIFILIIFYLIIPIIFYYIQLMTLTNNIKLSPDSKDNIIERDLVVISNRIRLEGYYSIGEIQTINGEKVINLKITKDLFNKQDLINQLMKKSYFQAKIGNDTAFIGGEEDITYVARTGDQSGIYSCGTYQSGEVCNFRFAISLSEKAAKKHANITSKLGIDPENPEYLDKKLDLYLDEKLVDSLNIGKELKGSKITQIAISGSGAGKTRVEAYDNATDSMKKLQAILISGSLTSDYHLI